LFTPDIPDDGVTEGNVVYDNVISDSESGIRSTKSQDNIVENSTFSDIESSEYLLSGDSSMIIRGQHFDDTSISEDGSATENIVEIVEIVDSGIIEVREEASNGEEDGDDDEEEEEENSYDTDDEPYRTILSDGDSITVNS
jgi:parallel beta-helix repeat protein